MARLLLPRLQHVAQVCLEEPVINKVERFVQQGHLHVRYHFGVVNNITVPLLVVTLFIKAFVNRIFPLERRIVYTRSRPVVITSEGMPSLGPLAVLQ